MKGNRFNVASLVLPLLLIGNSPEVIHAQTPDGFPPANEGVCDIVDPTTGATPGLYGLCVAYCEALDCADLEGGPSELPPQCSPPSPDILARYNKLKTDSDPEMPCVQSESECPCWSQDEMSAIGTTYAAHTMYASMWDFEYYDTFSLAEYRSTILGAYQYGQVYYWPTGPQCVYAYTDFDPDNYQYIVRFQEITKVAAQGCEVSIKNQYQSLIDAGETVPCGGNLCPQY